MDNENSNNYGVTDSPTNRPTLSTSTSSFEALNTHDPNLSRLATKMFQKSSEYVSHELVSSLEDYKLLENMNKVTVSKYSDMKQVLFKFIDFFSIFHNFFYISRLRMV